MCGIERPLRDFRDPAHEPACRDCEVRSLSEQERAVLEREEQDFRRRLKAGHQPTQADWDEAIPRRAALLGVSLRQYHEVSDNAQWLVVLWPVAYLVSAVPVGVFALVAGLLASPPELLPIALTILLLCAWPLLWLAFVYTQAYEDLSIRAELSHPNAHLILVYPLGALLLPVLTYIFVRIVLGTWP